MLSFIFGGRQLILIVFATETEGAPFLDGADWKSLAVGHKPLYRLKPGGNAPSLDPSPAGGEDYVEGKIVDVLISGMGQVNTAQALTAYFERCSPLPEHIIMGGCAGAFKGSGLNVGDVCFATEEIYADTGVYSTEGFSGLDATGIPLAQIKGAEYCNRIPVRDVSDKIEKSEFPFRISSGASATVCAVTGTDAAAAGMEKRWGVVCENMEGAAAAHVSLLYGAPFAEVRGISNMVEDRDRSRWDINTACANCALVIKKLVENL
jgi:futalosine hydrolase